MFDEKGKLRPYLLEARKRGVKFDVGHGGGSFSWGQAAPAIRQFHRRPAGEIGCRGRSRVRAGPRSA